MSALIRASAGSFERSCEFNGAHMIWANAGPSARSCERSRPQTIADVVSVDHGLTDIVSVDLDLRLMKCQILTSVTRVTV